MLGITKMIITQNNISLEMYYLKDIKQNVGYVKRGNFSGWMHPLTLK